MPAKTHDDERRFQEYFDARRDAVRNIAYLLCGDWHWADDLTQIALVKLAANWHRIRDPGAVNGYVRTCLVRAYLAECKRLWRRREQSFGQLPDVAGTGDGAEETASRLAVLAALRALPPRQRATVVCRFYEGLDVQSTAQALGCSTGTVKSQTTRALAFLRERLVDMEVVEDSGPRMILREARRA
jgi:RNA polymerase sigma-70 factor (sigma-E family)